MVAEGYKNFAEKGYNFLAGKHDVRKTAKYLRESPKSIRVTVKIYHRRSNDPYSEELLQFKQKTLLIQT